MAKTFLGLVIIAMVVFFTGCSPARQTARRAYREAPVEFYQHHSRVLGFWLAGTEDPRLITEVSSWVGVPYRFGGATRNGADCSGLVWAAYLNAYGMQLPRSTADQASLLKRTSRNRITPGDLVFFRINNRKLSHVGIYLGQGKFIHASTTYGVIVSDLDEAYYTKRYKAARKAVFR